MSDKPTLIDLGKERDARRKATLSKLDEVLQKLRDMPVPERGEVIVAMFSMVVSEFSRMVLDHVPSPPGGKGKRYARKVIRRSSEIQRTVRGKSP